MLTLKMAIFTIIYQKLAKKWQKKKKKKKSTTTKKSSLSLIIDQKIPKNVKSCFNLIRVDSFLVFKKVRIWLKVLRNIAIKLTAGEVTKLCPILMKI